MPSRSATAAEVVCPHCGQRFRLDDQITAHIHQNWERDTKQRIRRELRQEEEQKAERRVRREFEQALREREEEGRAKDRKLKRVERQLLSATVNASQKPSQDLGLVRQETLQALLESRFRGDHFQAIAVGRRGADLKQLVHDATGRNCGSILWEVKRGYKSWSTRWVSKLRTDQREGRCELGVIVSDVLPGDANSSFCVTNSVLACHIDAAPYLASLLRERLIEAASLRGARARRDDLKGAVYDYVSGPFIDYIQDVMEKIISMKATLERERRAKAAEWKQREAEIDGIAYDLAEMYGGLQGIGARLPDVPNLELPAAQVPPELPPG